MNTNGLRYVVGCVGLLALLMGAGSAKADHHFHPVTVGGALGQAFPDRPSEFSLIADKKNHAAAWLRYNLSEKLGVEFNFNLLNFEATGLDPEVNVYGLNVAYKLMSTPLYPIVALGAGWADVKNYGSDNQISALARLGLEYAISPDVQLGVYGQHTYVGNSDGNNTSEMYAWSYLAGLNLSFGGSPTAKPAAKPADPATPPPADADGDGVPDSADKCGNTPAGAKVNAYGCQATEKAQVKLNVNFANGQAQVDELGKAQIADLGAFMIANPMTTIVIEGHSDNVGSAAKNLKLSQARADAVRTELLKTPGLDASRVTAKGFGSANPVADNKTPEGRTANRRVVATISEVAKPAGQ